MLDGVPEILVVDDNPTVTKALRVLFKDAGYVAVTFNTGRSAVDYIESALPHKTPIAAIVDVHLPDLSGLVVVQKLRERLGNECPIIVLSGDTSMETLNSLPHVGATYFFSKPVRSAQLVERLRELV